MTQPIRISVTMDSDTFKSFVSFDLFHHRKAWRRPAVFTTILLVSAIICLTQMGSVSDAWKLSLVLAFAHHPKLLILDEPTSGLDPVVRDDLLDLFLEFVQDEEHAILISTHITSDLEKVADYVTFLHAGKLLLSKPKDELLWQYGILRCGEALFQKLKSPEVLAWRKKDYSYDVLVPDREAILRKYPEAVIDQVTMDEILLLYVKGVQGK